MNTRLVGTAGTRDVGRSKTLQPFHGSEVAFWPNARTHFAGVLQAVPDLPGSEIILESTANGAGGEFHGRWQQDSPRAPARRAARHSPNRPIGHTRPRPCRPRR